MPYDRNTDLPKSVRDTLPEHAQTIFRKAYNSARKQYGAENETKLMQVAWAAVKNVYEKKDDKWVIKKGKTAQSDAFLPSFPHTHPLAIADEAGDKEGWIAIATVGQPMNMAGEKTVYPTKEGFEMAVDLFNDLKLNGYVSKNHSGVFDGVEMTEQKFMDPFLYAKFNSEGEAKIKDKKSNGRSIDATVFALEKDKLTHFLVPGVSVLYGSHIPACTPQMGCASTGGNIDLEAYHKGGGKEKMEKEELDTPVTFTEEQAKAMVASAEAKVIEDLNNAHKVAITDLEKANETKITEQETEHAKVVKEAEDATTKLKEQIETELRGEIKTKLGMSDEVAKTLDVFSAEQLNAMKGWTMPETATAGMGIGSAAGESSETPREEILGTWDPVKGAFAKGYRRGE